MLLWFYALILRCYKNHQTNKVNEKRKWYIVDADNNNNKYDYVHCTCACCSMYCIRNTFVVQYHFVALLDGIIYHHIKPFCFWFNKHCTKQFRIDVKMCICAYFQATIFFSLAYLYITILWYEYTINIDWCRYISCRKIGFTGIQLNSWGRNWRNFPPYATVPSTKTKISSFFFYLELKTCLNSTNLFRTNSSKKSNIVEHGAVLIFFCLQSFYCSLNSMDMILAGNKSQFFR